MRLALATLVGTVVYFLVGWLVFEGVLGRFMAAHTTQVVGFRKDPEEASMAMLLLSCAAYALLLAVVFEWGSVRNMKEGLVLGAVVGVLVATMTNSYWYATSHFFHSWKPLVVDVLAAGITVGVMGAAVGWSLGAAQRWL